MAIRLDKILCVLLFFAALYFHENYWRSVWWDKWFFVMGAFTLYVCLKSVEKFHWSLAAFTLIIMTSSLWVFGWRQSYPGADLATILAMGKVAAYTYAVLTLFLLAATHFGEEEYERLGDLFALLCMVNSALIVWQTMCGKEINYRGGVFGNPSISGCFIAMAYPYLCFQKRQRLPYPNWAAYTRRLLYLVIPVIAVFCTKASQPVGVMVIVVLAALWHYKVRMWRLVGRPIGNGVWITALVLLFGFGLLWLSASPTDAPFNSTGRFEIWREAMGWWWANGKFWVGQGTGISQILLPSIQKEALDLNHLPSTMDWWLWFHSDWVQLLFENGAVGLLMGFLMYVYALKFSFRKSMWLFSAVAGCGATALFNFPVHFPFHALLMMATAAMVFDKKYLAKA